MNAKVIQIIHLNPNIMKEQYKCPNCHNSLVIDNNIVLLAKNKKGKKGLIHLHTELGNYSTKTSTDFNVESGELLCFICPICHFDLSFKENNKLARFIRIDDNNNESTIIISGVMGEECTYEVKEKKVTMSYGEHMFKYTNPEWYLED